MSKSIDNLKLSTLLELKQGVDIILETYGNELSNYATMYGDIKFENMSAETRMKYNERLKAKNLEDKIINQIEKIISEYYE